MMIILEFILILLLERFIRNMLIMGLNMGAKDYLLFFSSNMTTHTASSITVDISANTSIGTTA